MAGTFTFDGRPIPFEDGDTFVSALHRAGVLELSRSMKYHRPRGAYCMTGSCAGCLVDIDGQPNLTACTVAARTARVTSQNRIGSAKRDLLGVTDKVYRKGFDPHGAFTRPRVLNQVFLKAVRFMSGVGKVPDAPTATTPKRHTKPVDELIIGGGTKGLERARTSRAKTLLLVEEEPVLGGDDRWRPDPVDMTLPDHVEAWTGALAFGIYGDTVAVRRGDDLWEVTAKRITLATGHHDGWPLFPGNDRPGVMSLRGARRLLWGHGVLPGRRVVVHGTPEPAFVDAVTAAGGTVVAGTVTAVKGGTRVEKAEVDGAWVACDAVVCDVPGTPRIELAQQAGCTLGFQDGVLAPATDAKGVTSRKDVVVA